jgi:lipopolysaccharide export system protein LptA
MSVFPWEAAAAKPATPVKPGSGDSMDVHAVPGRPDEGMIDVSAGDVEIGASGPFSRKVPSKDDKDASADVGKEVLTLQKDVQILQPGTGSVLRGQKIKVVRGVETGDMERLEALGQVEIVMGERKAKGESLTYETAFGPVVLTAAGPRKEVLRNVVTVEGDPHARKPATLWSGGDAIQAMKFVMDLRRDTFRALGGAFVEVRLPADAAQAPAAAPKNSLFPGLSLAGGNKVFLSCDGDLAYEGFSGRVNLRRNAKIRQEGFLMVADEMAVQLEPPDAAAARAGPQSGVFAGALRALDCLGRVEILTPSQVVHCDQVRYDLRQQVLRLEMLKPADEVKVYFRDASQPNEFRATQVLRTRHHIDVDTRTEAIVDRVDTSKTPGPVARMRISPYNDKIPTPRQSPQTAK